MQRRAAPVDPPGMDKPANPERLTISDLTPTRAAPRVTAVGGGLSPDGWAAGLHLSALLGYVVPVLGFAAPIVVWQLVRGRHPELDPHGRAAANWILSLILYSGALTVLFLLLAAFAGAATVYAVVLLWALMGVLVLLAVVSPIVAAIKAGSGERWRYPLALTLLKERTPAVGERRLEESAQG